MSEIKLCAGSSTDTWIMKLNKEGIFFNRERYPSSLPDDFADAVIRLLEKSYKVKFEKTEPPYDRIVDE